MVPHPRGRGIDAQTWKRQLPDAGGWISEHTKEQFTARLVLGVVLDTINLSPTLSEEHCPPAWSSGKNVGLATMGTLEVVRPRVHPLVLQHAPQPITVESLAVLRGHVAIMDLRQRSDNGPYRSVPL